jgi:hypothetical protein
MSNFPGGEKTLSIVLRSNLTRLVMALAFATSLLSASLSRGQYGPFAELPGNWNGDGTITFEDGKEERITCKAVYVVGAEGNELQQNLRGGFN